MSDNQCKTILVYDSNDPDCEYEDFDSIFNEFIHEKYPSKYQEEAYISIRNLGWRRISGGTFIEECTFANVYKILSNDGRNTDIRFEIDENLEGIFYDHDSPTGAGFTILPKQKVFKELVELLGDNLFDLSEMKPTVPGNLRNTRFYLDTYDPCYIPIEINKDTFKMLDEDDNELEDPITKLCLSDLISIKAFLEKERERKRNESTIAYYP